MPVNSNGIVTARDDLTIDIDRDALWSRVQDFTQTDAETLRNRYDLGKDVQDWSVARAKSDVIASLALSRIVPIAYRPFSPSWTFYTGTSRGFQCRPRAEVMKHYVGHTNLGLLTSKGVKDQIYRHAFVTTSVSEAIFLSGTTASNAMNLPLYLYPEEGTLDQTIRVNFDPKLYAQIRKTAGLTDGHVAPDGTDAFRKATGEARPDEVKVFDYIYGVLHCPAYRATYAEFLKIDFPRIPFPASPETFRAISEKGEALRRLHLMENAAIGEAPYPFHGDGNSVVEKPRYENGRVWINGTGDDGQYFEGVPAIAWEFHIGGYQPAQKWLKDRKGRELTYDDIRHYQRIMKILAETDRIMRTIELPLD